MRDCVDAAMSREKRHAVAVVGSRKWSGGGRSTGPRRLRGFCITEIGLAYALLRRRDGRIFRFHTGIRRYRAIVPPTILEGLRRVPDAKTDRQSR